MFILRRPLHAFAPDPPPATPPAAPTTPPADPSAGATPPPAAPPAAPATPPADQAVPYDRFKAVNDAKAAAEQRAADAEARLTAIERQGMPDLDRARAEAVDAQTRADAEKARADAAEKRATDLERATWVRSAAKDFHDPEDAVRSVDLDNVTTEDAAKAAVKAVAERSQHLVRPPANQVITGGDMLQQILDQGKTTDGKPDPGKPVIPAEQLNTMSVEQLVALQERDPDTYQRSLAAAAQ